MKPNDFSPHRRIEHEFRRSINQLMQKYLNLSFPEGSTPEYVLNAFLNITKNVGILEDIASRIASRMVTQVKVSNARSWRAAASEASRGREIYDLLQKEMHTTPVGARVREMIEENSKLISSIPDAVRYRVNKEISEMQFAGERPETIAKHLMQRIPKLTKERAALIARTETSKAATALTRARSEDLGIEWYQWATSEDARVRPAHRLMDKVLVAWSDPPNPENLAHIKSAHGPYNAGNIYNCRCDSYPVINLDLITWPARVYAHGSITRMTRGKFVEFSGINRRVAA